MEAWCPKGTQEAADILSRSTGDFLVYFDPDVDGAVAGKFACMFLDAFGKKYETYINENRAHGFFYEDLERLRNRTVIAVDFSITEDKLQVLKEHNVRLINIDHHEVSYPNVYTYSLDGAHTDGVVINNQYAFEPESQRYLSGAGVVFYTFCSMYQDFDCELNRALVGLTLLSDIRPIENKNAEEFLRTCYRCRHPFIQHLIDITKSENDYNFGVPMLERNYIDYTFSPKFNALFRLNMGQTAIDLMMGKKPSFNLDDARQIQNQIRDYIRDNLKNPFDFNHLLDSCTSGVVHREVTATNFDGSVTSYTSPELNNLFLRYIDDIHISDSYKLSNFIGLTCSHVKGFGRSAIVYVGTPEEIQRGSFRGRFDSVKYLTLFRKYGLVCAGHENAFGIHDCKLADVDFAGLMYEMGILEAEAELREYENRTHDVSNMALFIRTDLLKNIALTNIYVRDSYRVYLKYTGTNVVRKKLGKMWEFTIDGIKVKCFDEDITPSNGYILPIYDRGMLSFYLKNIKK